MSRIDSEDMIAFTGIICGTIVLLSLMGFSAYSEYKKIERNAELGICADSK